MSTVNEMTIGNENKTLGRDGKIVYDNMTLHNPTSEVANDYLIDKNNMLMEQPPTAPDIIVNDKETRIESIDELSANAQNASHRSIYNPCMADTHSRIFGECPPSYHDNSQTSPRKNSFSSLNSQNLSTSPMFDKDEKAHYGKKSGGNPLTGEGYGSDNSGQRSKVPPGGHSTGLW